MIETFNKLQKIFGRPITLVQMEHDFMIVTLEWWGRSFEIWQNETVVDGTRQNTYGKWLQGVLQGCKRDDAGNLTKQEVA